MTCCSALVELYRAVLCMYIPSSTLVGAFQQEMTLERTTFSFELLLLFFCVRREVTKGGSDSSLEMLCCFFSSFL